jgi:hypothetical protein
MVSRTENASAKMNLADRVELRLSSGKQVDGLWIGTSLDREPEPILRRVQDALLLIKAYDGIRYNRLLCDLDRVWVRTLPGALGNFNRVLRACELDRRFVLAETTTSELIAATIVHEATHARLFHCGIGYDEKQRSRVERICFRRELAFAGKIPNGAHVREMVERTLPLSEDEKYWTNEGFEGRHNQVHTEALRDLGAPEWLVRTLLLLRGLLVRLRGR